ncbi:MAG: N-acetylmuramoyl-L-alanine amidase [Gammaproteobacteria bacterium]|nr:N-acetylmuramoyl-L-alanine amidase [Gammaproteobacteria bacterium]
MEIKNHRIEGENIKWSESPNQGDKFASGMPDAVIIHYTAGSSAESSVTSLSNPKQKVSAHLVVGRNGEIYQLVPFDTIAWHAGVSEWNGRKGYNKYSIGIEIDNAGILKPNGSGKYVSWFNKTYSPDEVIKAKHRNSGAEQYWHQYTEEQINAVFEICECLCENYAIREILGHEEIAPQRKTDPGPAFPLERLRLTVFENDREQESVAAGGQQLAKFARVTTPLLNIRKGPGISFEKTAEPLIIDSRVEVIESDNDWTKVRYSVEGWVSTKYLQA